MECKHHFINKFFRTFIFISLLILQINCEGFSSFSYTKSISSSESTTPTNTTESTNSTSESTTPTNTTESTNSTSESTTPTNTTESTNSTSESTTPTNTTESTNSTSESTTPTSTTDNNTDTDTDTDKTTNATSDTTKYLESSDFKNCAQNSVYFAEITKIEKIDGINDYVIVDKKLTSETGCYQSIQEALNSTSCGQAIIVSPGAYDEEIAFDDDAAKNCTSDKPFYLLALNPVIDKWTDTNSEYGAGKVNCSLDENDVYDCDNSTYSSVETFYSWDHNSYVTVKGFVSHAIWFRSKDYDNQTGCENCSIQQNLINVNKDTGIKVFLSHNSKVFGNHIYRAGGDDTNDASMVAPLTSNLEFAYNSVYGSGKENGPGCENWKECMDDYQGTDGFTLGNKVCGTKIHHNDIFHLMPNGTDGSDGDGLDFKHGNCSDNPNIIYKNYLHDVATGIPFHHGNNGLHFFQNIIANIDSNAITVMPGTECSAEHHKTEWDRGNIGDYYIYNNVLYNVKNGIIIKSGDTTRCKTDSGESDYRSLYNIWIFNNTITNYDKMGIYVGYISRTGQRIDESSDSLELIDLEEETIRIINNNVIPTDTSNKSFHIENTYVDYKYLVIKNNNAIGRFVINGTSYTDINDINGKFSTNINDNISIETEFKDTSSEIPDLTPSEAETLNKNAYCFDETLFSSLSIDDYTTNLNDVTWIGTSNCIIGAF